MPAQQQIEKRIQSILNLVGEVQKQLPTLRREGLVRALKGEIAVREILSDVFDDGLTVLGKGIVYGRKQTEAFVAKTHKKTNELLQLSQQAKDKAVKATAAVSKASESVHHSVKKATKSLKPKPSSMRKHAPRKGRVHATPVARSH